MPWRKRETTQPRNRNHNSRPPLRQGTEGGQSFFGAASLAAVADEAPADSFALELSVDFDSFADAASDDELPEPSLEPPSLEPEDDDDEDDDDAPEDEEA